MMENNSAGENPFLHEAYGSLVGTMNAQDRIQELKKFDIEKLRQVIALPGVQVTVRKAAERWLRKLEKKRSQSGTT